MIIVYIIWIVVLACAGSAVLPATLRFLRQHGLTAANYAGDNIPVGSGAVLALLFALLHTIAELTAASGLWMDTAAVIRGNTAAFLLVFAAGWIDDSIGDRAVKGFGGHWRQWRETRTPSTGAIKAGVIGIAAFWIVTRYSSNWAEGLLDWVTIVLAANAVNLLDVRPGRAWKSFYLGAAILLAAKPEGASIIWLLPSAAGGIALMPGDLRGKHMLGDCGSNLLGFALGCSLAVAAPIWLQGPALAVLAAMHRTAEKSSITAWIERHRWVRWLDRFGRV
ncbi:hypothetical protein FE783_06245 [Paenibacillus mesophilus]|uniref:hypothetical protein n=1 Tax=Paenibacillus mesophilus TaxID=2582849 RepID=UPI00110D7C97|nr:hypothetical protein [Paenibacillus mesophilus]TMV51382.1 hypothetical protein FE783_06245 [Paenibacillus mesophilus]